VLLLDEPFSSLDARLRVVLRTELKRLQQALGITTVFVTHDQHEALALSDAIGVMREGRLEQVGPPRELYDEPASSFVADFVGGTNVLAGILPGALVAVKPERVRLEGARPGEAAAERMPPAQAGPGDPAPYRAIGAIESVSYLGSEYRYTVRFGDQLVEARTPHEVAAHGRGLRAGDAAAISFGMDTARRLQR